MSDRANTGNEILFSISASERQLSCLMRAPTEEYYQELQLMVQSVSWVLFTVFNCFAENLLSSLLTQGITLRSEVRSDIKSRGVTAEAGEGQRSHLSG